MVWELSLLEAVVLMLGMKSVSSEQVPGCALVDTEGGIQTDFFEFALTSCFESIFFTPCTGI